MRFNRTNKAIETFNSHLLKLDMISDVKQGNNWKASLRDMLKLHVGPESSLLKRLDELYFTRKEMHVPDRALGVFTTHVYDESKKENFRDLVNNAINYIKINGVCKHPSQSNFLAGFNNTELISGIAVAIGLIFSIGNYLGKLEKDRELFQFERQKDILEKEIKELKNKNNKIFSENKQIIQLQNQLINSEKQIDSLVNETKNLKNTSKMTFKTN